MNHLGMRKDILKISVRDFMEIRITDAIMGIQPNSARISEGLAITIGESSLR